ncbi:MAG: YbaY family lipoprotein [Pseudooceanicola sp.]
MFACGLAVAAVLVPAVGQAEDEILTVSGQLTYRERIAVSPNAVMQVTIEDISRADAPSDTLAEFSSDLEQVPAPFTLNVPREEMRSRGLSDVSTYRTRRIPGVRVHSQRVRCLIDPAWAASSAKYCIWSS